jgi:uncharacterized membrane protein YfcA
LKENEGDNIELIVITLILLVALTFSPLGLGGGVLFVPILHYIDGWPLIEAIIGSLSMVWMVALGSSFAHSKGGYSDSKVVRAGRITAVPMAFVGTLLAWIAFEYISDIIIKIFAAAILVYVIERNLRPSDTITGSTDDLTTYSKVAGLGGLAAGLLGIGGGSIFVTINRRLAGLDTKTAAGTSYLIGAAVVPMALISHIVLDQTLPAVIQTTGVGLAITLPLLAFASAFIGAKFAIKYLPEKIIRAVFIVAVSISLSRYLWDIIGVVI